MCSLEDYMWMELDRYSRETLRNELDMWHRHYLPIRAGQTVIDIGAGCGETALFYLLHGADRVIAIEADKQKALIMEKNFKDNPKVTPICCTVGNVKMDIEGAEEGSMIALHGNLAFFEDYIFPDGVEHIWRIRKKG